MALFGTKKNTEKKIEEKKPKAVKVAKAARVPSTAMHRSVSYVLSRPRITEKASLLVETSNAYTFEVAKVASKHDVMKAVKEFYKVTPLKVTMTNLPSKTKFIRGKLGVKSGVKKATVYLRDGDKIEFI
jgi:large subunit ribosomal protein L23